MCASLHVAAPECGRLKGIFRRRAQRQKFFFPKFRNWRNINFALALLSAGIENDSEERARGKKRTHDYTSTERIQFSLKFIH